LQIQRGGRLVPAPEQLIPPRHGGIIRQGFFALNSTATALTMSVTIFNVDVTGTQTPGANDNLLNAHIHAGPAFVPGPTAPIVWGFLGSPDTTSIPISSS
jgi:hypothetical protein